MSIGLLGFLLNHVFSISAINTTTTYESNYDERDSLLEEVAIQCGLNSMTLTFDVSLAPLFGEGSDELTIQYDDDRIKVEYSPSYYNFIYVIGDAKDLASDHIFFTSEEPTFIARCRLPKKIEVGTRLGVTAAETSTTTGVIDLEKNFQFHIYDSEKFDHSVSHTQLGDTVFAKISYIEDQDLFDYHIKNCLYKFNDGQQAPIIRDYCYSSAMFIEKLDNDQDKTKAFKFITFLDLSSFFDLHHEIILQCDVKICLRNENKCGPEDSSSCKENSYEYTPDGYECGKLTSKKNLFYKCSCGDGLHQCFFKDVEKIDRIAKKIISLSSYLYEEKDETTLVDYITYVKNEYDHDGMSEKQKPYQFAAIDVLSNMFTNINEIIEEQKTEYSTTIFDFDSEENIEEFHNSLKKFLKTEVASEQFIIFYASQYIFKSSDPNPMIPAVAKRFNQMMIAENLSCTEDNTDCEEKFLKFKLEEKKETSEKPLINNFARRLRVRSDGNNRFFNLGDVTKSVGSLADPVISVMKEAATDVTNTAKDFYNSAKDEVDLAGHFVFKTIEDFMKNVPNQIEDHWDTLKDMASPYIDKVIDKIEDTAGYAVETVGGIVKSIATRGFLEDEGIDFEAQLGGTNAILEKLGSERRITENNLQQLNSRREETQRCFPLCLLAIPALVNTVGQVVNAVRSATSHPQKPFNTDEYIDLVMKDSEEESEYDYIKNRCVLTSALIKEELKERNGRLEFNDFINIYVDGDSIEVRTQQFEDQIIRKLPSINNDDSLVDQLVYSTINEKLQRSAKQQMKSSEKTADEFVPSSYIALEDVQQAQDGNYEKKIVIYLDSKQIGKDYSEVLTLINAGDIITVSRSASHWRVLYGNKEIYLQFSTLEIFIRKIDSQTRIYINRNEFASTNGDFDITRINPDLNFSALEVKQLPAGNAFDSAITKDQFEDMKAVDAEVKFCEMRRSNGEYRDFWSDLEKGVGIGLTIATNIAPLIRIVNGREISEKDYPMIAKLQFKKNGRTALCGGTAIHDNWILTAAHCCHDMEGVSITFNRPPATTESKYISSRSFVIHEKYKQDSSYDYCLIHVEDNIKQVWSWVQYPCMNVDYEFEKNDACFVIGYGLTSFNGKLSHSLEKVKISYLPHEYCKQYCFGMNNLEDQDICAGNGQDEDSDKLMDGGFDACQGDSGGPLFCAKPDNDNQMMFYFTGVVSRGEGCADHGSPGLYASVQFARSWIEDKMISS